MIDFFAVGDGQEDLARATSEVMEIFGVKPLFKCNDPLRLPDEMPLSTVFITHKLHADSAGISVKTLAEFRDKHGIRRQECDVIRLSVREENSAEIKRLVKINTWQLMYRITRRIPSSWGILRGVRPTKIVHRLLDNMMDQQAIEEVLESDYLVSAEKAKLTSSIAVYQRKWLGTTPRALKQISIYIGIPYCPTRCLYCSFPAYAIPVERMSIEIFLASLRQDMAAAAQLVREKGLEVQSVYIGGGTPTSLAAVDFDALVALAAECFITPSTLEFTVEAGRPDSIDDDKINSMKRYGVTRVSVNPQSMQENTLKHIGRNHTVEDIINIFGKIRNHNFPVINMDIIAGLPGETAEDMRNTLNQILFLGPENITIHTLAVKKGSVLKANQDRISVPGSEVVKAMLEIAKEKMAVGGLIPYYLYRQKYMTGQMENVGYTKPGMECIYNIQVMEERQTIIGIGPNAVTKGVSENYTLQSVYFPKDIRSYTQNIQRYIDKRDELIQSLYR